MYCLFCNQTERNYTPDEGTIRLRGQKVHMRTPHDAIKLGIGMVHQHFMLVPVMSVAENMIIGHEPTRWGAFLNIAAAKGKIETLCRQYGLNVDPNARISDLAVGIRQRVEILKTLFHEIFDFIFFSL